MTKKWTNFAKVACHFPGSHHLSLNCVWDLLHVLAWSKVGYRLSSQLTATEWVNLKTIDESLDGSPSQIFVWQKFHCQTLQAVGSGQIDDLPGSSEHGEPRSHRKTAVANGWSIVRLTKRKREQDVNAAMDKGGVSQTKKCQKVWSLPDLCSKSV